MFVIPWGDLTYIGTTDTDTTETPDDVRPSAEDVIYLLRSANALFPRARLGAHDIISAWSGLRPLLRPDDPRHPSNVSREHKIVEGPAALISVVGGKLTTYRSMAAETVNLVVDELRKQYNTPTPPPAPTDREPLPGCEVSDLQLLNAEVEREGASPDAAAYLVSTYGSEAVAVQRLRRTSAALSRAVAPNHPACGGDLIHAVRREMAVGLIDLLVRRTHIYYEVGGQGVPEASNVADLVGGELGWGAEHKADEVAKYVAFVEYQNAFRGNLAGHEF
jgi:glycerol-3-phosphate dehydrogenase